MSRYGFGCTNIKHTIQLREMIRSNQEHYQVQIMSILRQEQERVLILLWNSNLDYYYIHRVKFNNDFY